MLPACISYDFNHILRNALRVNVFYFRKATAYTKCAKPIRICGSCHYICSSRPSYFLFYKEEFEGHI